MDAPGASSGNRALPWSLQEIRAAFSTYEALILAVGVEPTLPLMGSRF